MRTLFVNGKIYSEKDLAFLPGALLVENEKIAAVLHEGDPMPEADRTVDLGGALVAPGLVDVHTHGRAGYDFNTAGEDGMRVMAHAYAESGVTTLMPTLASAPFEALCGAADKITKLSPHSGGARFAGVHLEGRYLNPEKRGAHAIELLAPLDARELEVLLSHMPVPCHVSAALELDKDGSFASAALRHGATLGLAHTAATSEEAELALARGATSFTHLFNAMPPLHHRHAGAACVGLVHEDAYAELICDGLHICPEMVQLAYRCKGMERLVLITDSMEATGCADGSYHIAGMEVIVRDGKAITVDGAIAGSTLNLLDGVRNLAAFCHISFAQALVCATRNPARMVGIDDKVGTLEVGKYADFLVLTEQNESVSLREVYTGGRRMDNVCASKTNDREEYAHE